MDMWEYDLNIVGSDSFKCDTAISTLVKLACGKQHTVIYIGLAHEEYDTPHQQPHDK